MSNEPRKYLAIILAPASLTEDISRVAAPASEAYFNLRIFRDYRMECQTQLNVGHLKSKESS